MHRLISSRPGKCQGFVISQGILQCQPKVREFLKDSFIEYKRYQEYKMAKASSSSFDFIINEQKIYVFIIIKQYSLYFIVICEEPKRVAPLASPYARNFQRNTQTRVTEIQFDSKKSQGMIFLIFSSNLLSVVLLFTS